MKKNNILVAVAMVTSLTAAAQAAEIKIMAGGAATPFVREVAADYTKRTGNKVEIVSDTAGALTKRIQGGETADLVVITVAGLDALQKDNLILAAGRTDLARGLIGVAIPVGAKKPDISTPEAFKASLLAAGHVSYVDPKAGGTSGTYFEGLLVKMGIADAMKSKIVYGKQGAEVAETVAQKKADMGITFTSELMPNKGVTVVGTLPDAYQMPTVYAAAVATKGVGGEPVQAFMEALRSSVGYAAISKSGLEPLVKK